MASNALPNALAILATSYERDGFPIQAIHCLQALLSQQLPPDFEAKARLHIGRLLLEHTYNFREASTHLLRAQILARGLIGNHCLKFEVHDQLATLYQYTREEAMELQAYNAVAELRESARGSSEWPTVCNWVCRMAQRAVALHARAGRATDAQRAAAEGLAFAEANGLLLQRMVFLLSKLQLALARWDHEAADDAITVLNALLNNPAAAAAAAAAAAGGGGGGSGGAAAAPVLDPATYQAMVLHFSLLQVLYMLRLGKVTEIAEDQEQQARQRQQQAQGAADVNAPNAPPPLPPVLQQLESSLARLQELSAARAAEQQQAGQQGPPLPYSLPGLPSLEPLVCLACVSVLRPGCHHAQLTQQYLQRGLACTAAYLAEHGVPVEGAEPVPAAGAPAAPNEAAAGAHPGGELVGEAAVRPQLAGALRPMLLLHVLLLESRAQIMMSKAELRAARDQVLCCQRLLELFPGLLAVLRPGVQLLTGQYCLATGDPAVAAVHFELARTHATSWPAAALAAVLQAEAHLARPQGAAAAGAASAPEGQAVDAAGVARALAALGPFYTAIDGAVPGGEGNHPLPGALGHFEETACRVVSAACLVRQGQIGPANQLLSRSLKVAHKRLGSNQLVCAILTELAPTFLAQRNAGAAREVVKSAVMFSQASGNLWAEASAQRQLVATLKHQGEHDKAAAAAASAGRRQERIAAAAAEAAADSGRHGFASYWGLRAVG